MGIMDFFRKKYFEEKDTNEVNEHETNEGNEVENFVADISFFELDNADWSKFGSKLKQNKILPNSYVKIPSKVDVLLDKKYRPKVILEFKSATSNSIREFMLLQDGAFQYVNGAIDDGKDENLLKVWKSFQAEIRYVSMINTNREGYAHARRGARLLIEAQKLMSMKDLYDREQEFLEKNKDVKFDEFCYSTIFEKDSSGIINYAGELPKFIPLKATEDGHFVSGDPVIPFTPKTLEHCILHMTNGQKIEDGENLDDFEKKCRKIQEYSCFESEDWDKVIEFGKNVVRTQYQLDCLEHDF